MLSDGRCDNGKFLMVDFKMEVISEKKRYIYSNAKITVGFVRKLCHVIF